jgi:protein translocase SecG subunit
LHLVLSLIADASPAAVATAASVAAPVVKASPFAQASAAAQVPISALQSLTAQYRPQTPLQQHAGWLTHTFAGLVVLGAILLIALLAIQTTKQEGLSGTIGGRVESSYRGRLGMEGQIARITGYVAIGFVIVATLVSISGI